MINEYNEAIQYLYSRLPMFSRVGAAAYKPGLQTTIDLDRAFGCPHKKFKTIHVAGTNGKGSVSHTLAAILQAQGYKTALYTSPHLADFRERMRINGEMIPRSAVIDFVNRWQSLNTSLTPSFFELTMMMAFDWFASENVDYAVIEVGMGGRLDSTNIISPEACIITNISPDHMQFLGSTLSEIATEKAGIIKECTPVVIGESEGDVRRVFAGKAAEMNAPVTFADDKVIFTSTSAIPEGGWKLSLPDGRNYDFMLAGDYQKRNAATVLAAVDMLRSVGISLSEDSVHTGLRNVQQTTGLRGRWMRLSDNPMTICDTGHNEAGLRYNMQQLQRMRSTRSSGCRLRIVAGVVADKDIEHILSLLIPDAVYYFCNADIPRALPAGELAQKAAKFGLGGAPEPFYPSVAEAYEAAVEDCGSDDILFIGGSTFVIADLLAYLDSL